MNAFCTSILSVLLLSAPDYEIGKHDNIISGIDDIWLYWIIMGCLFILAIPIYFWTRNTEQGSKSYLYACMRDHGPDHPFTRSALEEATEKKMKRDGYPDPFVKAFHTMGGKWEGEVSWGHTATNDFNVCKITIQTDGYNVSYQIGESKF